MRELRKVVLQSGAACATSHLCRMDRMLVPPSLRGVFADANKNA